MGLSPAEAIEFVRAHGLVSGDGVRAAPLGGGVSNETILVEDGSRRVVVKQALGQLRTEVQWHAPPGRALDEAAALRLAAELTPEQVPPLLAVDPSTATIALQAAPAGWRDWKVELFDGTVRPDVGAVLGTTLGTWHRRTSPLVADLDGMALMDSLRLVPFHDVVARRHEDLAGRIGQATAQLRQERLCFVHGDFSPKNVLTGESGLWLIDFEVAHLSNPVFDLAFLQAHLLLKGVAIPSVAGLLRNTAGRYLSGYDRTVRGSALDLDRVLSWLPLHAGCLVLARVDGTSVVDYLDPSATERARTLGRQLTAGAVGLDEAWAEVSSHG